MVIIRLTSSCNACTYERPVAIGELSISIGRLFAKFMTSAAVAAPGRPPTIGRALVGKGIALSKSRVTKKKKLEKIINKLTIQFLLKYSSIFKSNIFYLPLQQRHPHFHPHRSYPCRDIGDVDADADVRDCSEIVVAVDMAVFVTNSTRVH